MFHSPTNLEDELLRVWPAADWRDVHVLLAVSGGADSVAMLRAMLAVKTRAGGTGRLFAAHLDHGLRGQAGAADAAWLADLCREVNVPLEVARVDVASLAACKGDGWESAARDARYDFLRQAAERVGARFVATAHTADDQVETVLHHVVRGTGLAGLAGMPFSRALSPTVTLVRPLLFVPRADVLSYLADIGQTFRTDATNLDRRFTRNRLRHELLPLLRAEFNPECDAAILRLARQASEAQAAIAQWAQQLAERSVERSAPNDASLPAERLLIDSRPLAGQPPLIVREVFKTAWTMAGWPMQDMGFDQWQQLAEMVGGGGARSAAVFPGRVAVRHDGPLLVLER